MRAKYILYFTSLLLLLLVVWLEYSKPKTLSWEPTFYLEKDNPLDLSILYQQKDQWAPKGCRVWAQNPYAYLKHHAQPQHWLYISESNNIDGPSWRLLLQQVHDGARLFVSCPTMPRTILDSLHLSLEVEQEKVAPWAPVTVRTLKGWKSSVALHRDQPTYWELSPSQRVLPLGYFRNVMGQKRLNFIQLRYGKGKIWLHTQPQAFANIALTQGHQDYAEAVLAYTPSQPWQWLAYEQIQLGEPMHPLSEIAKHPELRWAQRIAFFLALMLLLWSSQRQHRRIRVFPPLKNTSLPWLGTLGGLYVQQKAFGYLAQVKSRLVYERLYQKWRVHPDIAPYAWAEQLSKVSGVSLSECELLAQLLHQGRHVGIDNTAKDWLSWYRRVQPIYRQLW